MINPFLPGDQKIYETVVSEDKLATFESGNVHPVYGTFALGKDAEWACRLFVLEMKAADEEGIGTFLSVEHISPALLGAKVQIIATLESVIGIEVICSYEVFCGERLIAKGKQHQKILDRNRFERTLRNLAEKTEE